MSVYRGACFELGHLAASLEAEVVLVAGDDLVHGLHEGNERNSEYESQRGFSTREGKL